MKRSYVLIVLLLIVFRMEAQQFTMEYGGTTRSYIVHLPTGYTSTGNFPLVLNFHGLTSNAQQQQFLSRMDAVSNANKFIVVYPNGLNNTWNIGFASSPDDAGFINALLDVLTTKYSVNRERIYACGFSMGGFFSYYLACRLNNRIAAIASVSGVMASTNSCTAPRNVPVVHFHGTNDLIVPYGGVAPSLNYWRNHNKCTAPAQITSLPNINTIDNSTVDLIKYGACADNAEVWHYRINNGGHTWPGGAILGNRDINASQEIWNFFKRYTLTPATATVASVVDIEVFPNPAKDKLSVSFNSPMRTEVGISIVNPLEKSATDLKVNAQKGANNFDLDISNLTNGLHLIMISYGKERIMKKVYVTH